MIRITFLVTILLSAVAYGVQAQERGVIRSALDLQESEFGVIPDSLYKISRSDGTPFEYLLKEAVVRFDEIKGNIVSIIDYHIRIKVYSDDELAKTEASLVGIPYYYSDNMEEIVNLKAITHQPDGSKDELNQDDFRTVDLNTRYKVREFTMPNVQKGSIIEYRYRVIRRYIEELPDFYFSHRVPTRKASLTLLNERYLRFDVVPENINFDLKMVEQRVDTSNIPLVFSYSRPEPVLVQKWSAQNIPAISESAYISSIDDLRGKLKFQISEFGIPRQPLDNSWDLVAAQIRRTVNPMKIVDKNIELKEMGKQIANSLEDEIAIQDSIFNLVNSKAQFNGMNGAFSGDDFSKVLEGEPSNQADINMVLLSMLRGADIDAWPLYISGRDFGRINKAFPSVYQFNRMLVVSYINGREYFMDASFPESSPDLIPVESYNEQGLLIKNESHKWLDIKPKESRFDLEVDLKASVSADGTLSGTISVSTAGYPAQQLRKESQSGKTANEVAKSIFFEAYTDAEISNTKIERTGPKNQRVNLQADFKMEEYAASFTDGLQFRPMIVGYLFRNPFESTTREAPITLDAPEKIRIRYEISVPEGFNVEEANESRSTNLPGASLTESYSTDKQKIVYIFNVEISNKEFPADLYSQLRRLYERWVTLSNDEWFIEDRRS
ncbi:MAG: DUF3857 domain-containing protein [Balneolaceae bacterium]